MNWMQGEGLTKSYRRGSETVHALENVSLDLRRREVVALVGPSGSGKTTLLYLLAGWEVPDGGRILWDEDETLPAGLLWNDLALVPQSLGLIEELTVRENVTLPLRLDGSREEPQRVDTLMDQLGLSGLADRYPLETSLGEQQRAAMARALVAEPKVVLADEPTGHQDAGWAEAVFFLLGRAAADGACCLVATHDPGVAAFADRVISMRDGRIEGTEASESPRSRDISIWAPSRPDRP
jgi:putative ABC transport system ATP-binding protein